MCHKKRCKFGSNQKDTNIFNKEGQYKYDDKTTNNVTMCKFRAQMICDEVTDETTDVVYLPGNPYTVASQG